MSWTDAVAAVEHEPVVSWMQREREEAWQEGWREGWREGFEEGWQEGFEEGRQDVLRRALVQRFGTLRPEHERTLTEASPERLDRLFERTLTAPTAAAVFETPSGGERGAA